MNKSDSHSHGNSNKLSRNEAKILENGILKLLEMTEGMDWKNFKSERYPNPLLDMCYEKKPEVGSVRMEITKRMKNDPIGILGKALVLLELFESNQTEENDYTLDDLTFIRTAFNSKRANGWISILGNKDRDEFTNLIKKKWQFYFFDGRNDESGIYQLLNMLARYAFIYGRISKGDSHSMGHYIEDFCPGIIVCREGMTDLELTLSLAAMKMGVPAIVYDNYPFSLGGMIRLDNLEKVSEAVVYGFRNIRRLLLTPDSPGYPDYCDIKYFNEEFKPARSWGISGNSFYILRKGKIDELTIKISGFENISDKEKENLPMGVIITIDAEPMDVFDRYYIERLIPSSLSMMEGIKGRFDKNRIEISINNNVELDPNRLGEVLIAAIKYRFPKIKKISVEIIFLKNELDKLKNSVDLEIEERNMIRKSFTEENIPEFYQCVGCSQFAPDHMCVLTPERSPQCGKPFEQVKTGALYAFDDKTRIHHSWLHRNINSYSILEKGICLDPIKGEWSGPNENAKRRTQGRTTRIFLHSLDDNPHTGCGCFRLILFKTNQPKKGVGIMDFRFDGTAPDGRTWLDLHYALAGKQTPGITGASHKYLNSPKFIKDHGGWDSVVWVSPNLKQIAEKNRT